MGASRHSIHFVANFDNNIYITIIYITIFKQLFLSIILDVLKTFS